MKTLFITVILAVVLIGIAIVALGIKVLFVKGCLLYTSDAADEL